MFIEDHHWSLSNLQCDDAIPLWKHVNLTFKMFFSVSYKNMNVGQFLHNNFKGVFAFRFVQMLL